jgi:hypothetical protein
MSITEGGSFVTYTDPNGNKLAAVNRDGSVLAQAVTFSDGTSQTTAASGGTATALAATVTTPDTVTLSNPGALLILQTADHKSLQMLSKDASFGDCSMVLSAGEISLNAAAGATGGVILQDNGGFDGIQLRTSGIGVFVSGGDTTFVDGHILGNGDISGTLAISAATSATKTFTTAYGSAPIVVIAPVGDPGAGIRYWVTSTTGGFTIHLSGTATVTFSYHVIA